MVANQKTMLLTLNALLIVKITPTLSCNTTLPIYMLANATATYIERDILFNKIRISWHFVCDLHRQIINNYTIDYSPSPDFKDKKTIHLENYNKTFYNLEHLQDDTIYRISLYSLQFNKVYGLYGQTKVNVPNMPTKLWITFQNYKKSFFDIKYPILNWNLTSTVKNKNILSYFNLTIQEFKNIIFLNKKIEISICTKNNNTTCILSNLVNFKLQPSKTYTFSVRSCNRKMRCSLPFKLDYKMPPKKPGKINKPNLKYDNLKTPSIYYLNFDRPNETNGPIDEYHMVQLVTIKGNDIEQKYIFSSKWFKENRDHLFSVNCNSNLALHKTYFVKIAAANIEIGLEENITWVGEFSEFSHINLCFKKTQDNYWLNVLIGVLIILLFWTILIIYIKIVKYLYLSKKIKNLEINVLSNEPE